MRRLNACIALIAVLAFAPACAGKYPAGHPKLTPQAPIARVQPTPGPQGPEGPPGPRGPQGPPGRDAVVPPEPPRVVMPPLPQPGDDLKTIELNRRGERIAEALKRAGCVDGWAGRAALETYEKHEYKFNDVLKLPKGFVVWYPANCTEAPSRRVLTEAELLRSLEGHIRSENRFAAAAAANLKKYNDEVFARNKFFDDIGLTGSDRTYDGAKSKFDGLTFDLQTAKDKLSSLGSKIAGVFQKLGIGTTEDEDFTKAGDRIDALFGEAAAGRAKWHWGWLPLALILGSVIGILAFARWFSRKEKLDTEEWVVYPRRRVLQFDGVERPVTVMIDPVSTTGRYKCPYCDETFVVPNTPDGEKEMRDHIVAEHSDKLQRDRPRGGPSSVT
jgi:hypothetical protein